MNDWLASLINSRGDVYEVIGFVGKLEGTRFSVTPEILERISFAPLGVEIVYEYNTFSLLGDVRRFGICLFEYKGTDYIYFSESVGFKMDASRVYGLSSDGYIDLGNLLGLVLSDYESFIGCRDTILLTHKVFKDRKKLSEVIGAVAEDGVGTFKV